MNLICKLLGHKWRDTSYWEFKRENEVKMRRKISQAHCDRCDKTEVFAESPWEVEKTMSEKMRELGRAYIEGFKKRS